MKIIGDGYRTVNGQVLAEKLVEENRAGFEYLEKAIQQFRSLAASRHVSEQFTAPDKQKIIALTLSVRLLEIAEAALAVMRLGMSNEANSLFRVFLDAYFVFGNVCADDAFVAEYFKSDDADRLKLINAARKHSSEVFEIVNSSVSEEHRSDLKAKIENEKIQAFNSYNYTVKIGCEGIYDSMYRLVSSFAHTTPRVLSGYVEEDAVGIVLSVRDGPSEGDIPQRLHDFSYFIIKALSGLQETFECLDQSEIKRLIDDLTEVPKKLNVTTRCR